MNISSFYRLLHLFNTFLQIGKTFFTGEPFYIHKFREVTKKINHVKEDQKMKNRKKYFIIGAVILFFGVLAGLGVTGASGPHVLHLFPFNIRSAGGRQVLARLWRVRPARNALKPV